MSRNILQFRNVTAPLEKMPGKSSDLTNGCSRELEVALVETLGIPSFSEIQAVAIISTIDGTVGIPPFIEIQAVATISSIDGTGMWLVEGSRFDIPILVVGALVTLLQGKKR